MCRKAHGRRARVRPGPARRAWRVPRTNTPDWSPGRADSRYAGGKLTTARPAGPCRSPVTDTRYRNPNAVRPEAKGTNAFGSTAVPYREAWSLARARRPGRTEPHGRSRERDRPRRRDRSRRFSEGTPTGAEDGSSARPVKPSYRCRRCESGGSSPARWRVCPPPRHRRATTFRKTVRARAEVYPTLGQTWPT